MHIMQHITIASLLGLWNEWEIQFMILLSLMLQFFLFFTGSLRRYQANMLLRFSIWLAYLGADMVAVYALGLLSRYPITFEGIHTLAFIWAPFLLVHLGGQDTITAFSIEDNNLWSRHLVISIFEVSLASYVFWKSRRQVYMSLVVSVMFIFVTGVIKYGERTWALRCGKQNGLQNSNSDDNHNMEGLPIEEGRYNTHDRENMIELPIKEDGYCELVCYALSTVVFVRGIFAGRTIFQMGSKAQNKLYDDFAKYEGKVESKLKILEMELGMMYDVLYTKAMVTQTWAGAIFRCVSRVSLVFAFLLFVPGNKDRYSRVDVAITYLLLSGGLFMEICSFFIMLVSPWTWASLKARKCRLLANLCWYFFQTVRPEGKRWWSTSIGQYNFRRSLVQDRSSSVSAISSKLVDMIGLKDIWKFLRHCKHVKAKIEIIKCVIEWSEKTTLQKVPNLGDELKNILHEPFEHVILKLHLFTDLHIRARNRRSTSSEDQPITDNDEISNVICICEKISNYMLYILVFYPSMLPVSGSAQDTLESFSKKITSTNEEDILYELRYGGLYKNIIFSGLNTLLDYIETNLSFHDSLVEIKEMWIRLLVYAACKSPAKMHAQQLGNGGELLTFIWLLIGAHHAFGDIARQFDLVSPSPENKGAVIFIEDRWAPVGRRRTYLFNYQTQSDESKPK